MDCCFPGKKARDGVWRFLLLTIMYVFGRGHMGWAEREREREREVQVHCTQGLHD